MFATVASFSGVTDIVLLGLPWELTIETINALFSGPEAAMRRWGNPVTDEAYWRANNPADLAANLAGKKGVYIAAGDGTPTMTEEVEHGPGLPIEMAIEHVTWQMTRSYDEKLTAAGVEHEYRPHAGIHSPDYWRTDLSLWWPSAIDVIT
jgi:S-formylglutathione hydrolase FrmB